jgi:hypothetical protein
MPGDHRQDERKNYFIELLIGKKHDKKFSKSLFTTICHSKLLPSMLNFAKFYEKNNLSFLRESVETKFLSDLDRLTSTDDERFSDDEPPSPHHVKISSFSSRSSLEPVKREPEASSSSSLHPLFILSSHSQGHRSCMIRHRLPHGHHNHRQHHHIR